MKNMISLLMSSAFLFLSVPLLAHPTDSYQNPAMSSGQIHWQRNYSDAVGLSQSTSKPIVILFTGTGWCPACMKLEREVLNHPQFTQAVGQRFVFLKAEFPDYSESAIMTSPYKSLLDRYGVDAFPTLVVVNANGQQLYRVNYQEGGPQFYIQQLLGKLNQGTAMPQPRPYGQ